MNRIKACFDDLKRNGRCGAIAYVTCGDPDPETTVRIVAELERSGADAIELGVPFSDPIADGPVIQAASWRALKSGTTIEHLFSIARTIRAASAIPLIAFSYFNPIMRFGVERFAGEAASAGIDSLLVTDLPPESAGEVRRAMKRRSLGMVFLLAPTSTQKRIRLVDRMSDGFIYYVSTNGVTGARRDLDAGLVETLAGVRRSVKTPLAVGFGISEHSHYAALAPNCDSIVVGSAIVRAVAAGDRDAAPARAGAVLRRILGRDTTEDSAEEKFEEARV